MTSPVLEQSALAGLGPFIAGLRWDDVPARVRERARIWLLDGLAVAFAGHDSPAATHASTLARDGLLGAGPSTYWLTGGGGPADAAAFVNTTAMQSILLLDGGLGGHPGSHVVPAALGAAEAAGARGDDLLAAIVAGYEVQARFDTGQLRVAPQRGGLRGTPILGCFGAAAAAARALSLPEAQAVTALAYAASLAFPTIWDPVLGLRSDERSTQNAANTRNGVLAALLARAGFAGSPTALEGEGGLYAAWLAGEEERPDLLGELGAVWHAEKTFIHAYPTGGGSLGPIFCAERIADGRRHAPDEIRSVEVRRFGWRANSAYVDQGPFRTVEQAVVSTYFGVACALVHGTDWPAMKAGLGDPQVDELARKISVSADPSLQTFIESTVDVTFADGRVARADSREMPTVLLTPTWDEMMARAAAITPDLSPTARDRLVAAVDGLPDAGDLGDLCDAIRGCASDLATTTTDGGTT